MVTWIIFTICYVMSFLTTFAILQHIYESSDYRSFQESEIKAEENVKISITVTTIIFIVIALIILFG